MSRRFFIYYKKMPINSRRNTQNEKNVRDIAAPPTPQLNTNGSKKPLRTGDERQGLCPCGGRGTRWRRYRVTKRSDCLGKNCTDNRRKNIHEILRGEKLPPLTLKGTGGSFYLEGVLLITCSVSYSKELTW